MVDKGFYGDGSRVEFRGCISVKDEKFLQDVIAFANTSGGKIIIGISEQGEIVGLGETSRFRLEEGITDMISDACTPQIDMDVAGRSLEGKSILEVDIYPGRSRPYYLKAAGRDASTYIRVNGTSRPAGESQIHELDLEGSRVSYDTLPEIGAEYDENAVLALADDMYKRVLATCGTKEERAAVKPMTVEKMMDFGIIGKNGVLRINRAFTLLTKPRDRYVKIQCALFKGTEREIFIDRKEFFGAIQDQLDEAYNFVLRHIDLGAEIKGLYRRDIYELPVKSVREIIANAVVHRSYLNESAIQVSIFDDRIEIDSPGMLYGGLTSGEVIKGGRSKCRNMAIAQAFSYMRIIEAWGTGIPTLFRQCESMGLPKPLFEEYGDGIRVTIFRKRAIRSAGRSSAGEETGKMPDIISTVLEIIRHNENVTQSQIAASLGVDINTIKYYVKVLRKNGYLSRSGSTRNGKWNILKELV